MVQPLFCGDSLKEQCTARCSQRVAQRTGIQKYPMRTDSVLTPRKQGMSIDELGHFNGEKCTAPCLQGVSTEFVFIEKVRVCKV